MVLNQIPLPERSTSDGVLAVEVEAADTRGATLYLTRSGFIKRRVVLNRNGLVVVRLLPGNWKAHVVGRPGGGRVVRFDGVVKAPKAVGSGLTQWPKKSLKFRIVRNALTNGGRICAHSACSTSWTSTRSERFDAWQVVDRFVEYTPPAPVGEKESPAK